MQLILDARRISSCDHPKCLILSIGSISLIGVDSRNNSPGALAHKSPKNLAASILSILLLSLLIQRSQKLSEHGNVIVAQERDSDYVSHRLVH